jgi:opacity protein-like surface antigen
MSNRLAAASFCVLALAAPAWAWEVQEGPLPTFARSSSAGIVSQGGAAWSDFSSGDFSLTASGYSMRADNLLLGMDARSPWSSPRFGAGLQGLGFNTSSIKLGYDFGQVRPFVSAGFGTAAMSPLGLTGFSMGGDPLQGPSPFGGPSFTTVGAGFDVAITNNLSVGFSASMTQLRGPSP